MLIRLITWLKRLAAGCGRVCSYMRASISPLDYIKPGVASWDGGRWLPHHGISPDLIEEARKKRLNIVDATCKDVYKTHTVIKEYLDKNFNVIYIGKKSHPEPEGVMGIDERIELVSNTSDIDKLNINNEKILVTNQTTMSKYDIQELFDYIKEKFPSATILEEICEATSQRQEIALKNAKLADLTFVVGDKNSNNTNRLVQICSELGNCPTYRIDTIEDIDIKLLLNDNVNTVHITSGASTPTLITSEIIKFLEDFNKNDKNTWNTTSNIELKKLIPRIK